MTFDEAGQLLNKSMGRGSVEIIGFPMESSIESLSTIVITGIEIECDGYFRTYHINAFASVAQFRGYPPCDRLGLSQLIIDGQEIPFVMDSMIVVDDGFPSQYVSGEGHSSLSNMEFKFHIDEMFFDNCNKLGTGKVIKKTKEIIESIESRFDILDI